MSEKTQGEELKERLFDCKKNGWESTSEEEGRKIFRYCDGYINFLSKSKTIFFKFSMSRSTFMTSEKE